MYVHSYSVDFAEGDFAPALYDVLDGVSAYSFCVCYTCSPVNVCVSAAVVRLGEELCVPVSVVVAPCECQRLDVTNLGVG